MLRTAMGSSVRARLAFLLLPYLTVVVRYNCLRITGPRTTLFRTAFFPLTAYGRSWPVAQCQECVWYAPILISGLVPFMLRHSQLAAMQPADTVSYGSPSCPSTTYPAHQALTRVYNQPTKELPNGKHVGLLYKNPIDCLWKTLQAEGPLGWYKGMHRPSTSLCRAS